MSDPYYKSHPMPLTSFIKVDTPNEGDELDIIIQPGAYYYSKSPAGVYEIVRLLEHRADSLHLQVVSTTHTKPTIENAKVLKPSIFHIPLPPEYLFSAKLVYLGSAPLTEEDLVGYKVYLDQLDFYSTRSERMISDIIWQSKKDPLSPVHMKYHNGEILS